MRKLIWLVVIVGMFILIFMRNKKRSLKTHAAYYAQKRKEFPWLDNWLKNVIAPADPAVIRGETSSSMGSILSVAVFLVIIVIASFFFHGIVAEIITLVIAVGIGELISRHFAKNPGKEEPEAGLTLECPSCHCPHSWVMRKLERIVENKSELIKVSTSTRSHTSTDWGFGSTKTIYKTTTEKVAGYTYSGREIKDFECLNCGHTEHNEYKEYWNQPADNDVEPESGVFTFNPPKTAWEYRETSNEETSNEEADSEEADNEE